MTILITGANGQLGAELCRQLGGEACGVDRDQFDVCDRQAFRQHIEPLRPSAVVHCAAYTQVDQAEAEPDRCWQVNAAAVKHIAETCQQLDCRLVYVSTDYVFGADASRNSPYTETDPPGPLGTYAQSKLRGEEYAATCSQHFVVRTCGLYGPPAARQKPQNFVETMLRLAGERDQLSVVADQHCTPTCTAQLAVAIRFLMDTGQYGTYHITNRGAATWYDFAAEIFRQSQIDIRLVPITSAQFGAAAPRPSYSVLDTRKYAALGGPVMSDWKSALAEYLAGKSPGVAMRESIP